MSTNIRVLLVDDHAVVRERQQGGTRRCEALCAQPALVDVAHFASEWPWVPLVASRLATDLAEHLVRGGSAVMTARELFGGDRKSVV